MKLEIDCTCRPEDCAVAFDCWRCQFPWEFQKYGGQKGYNIGKTVLRKNDCNLFTEIPQKYEEVLRKLSKARKAYQFAKEQFEHETLNETNEGET